jgi:ferredoxin-NADP reductase
METLQVRLKKRAPIAKGTMAFYFEKPQGFAYTAGQYLNITLIDPPETDREGNIRPFSIASAPFEEDLMIATRMRDTAFKRVLGRMPLGSRVDIKGPLGAFTLHNDPAKPAVFLAGGIGATPFFSMSKQAAHERLLHKIFLFYSNRKPEDAAFLKDLQDLEKENPNFKLIATMTSAESNEKWDGEKGYINREMLSRHLEDLSLPIYYTAGPPAMVASMRKMLVTAGVNPDNVRSEDFSGY